MPEIECTYVNLYIPRIQLDADKDNFPFEWSRRQFPVRVAFMGGRFHEIGKQGVEIS